MQVLRLSLFGVLVVAPLYAGEPELRDKLQDEHAVGADGWIYNDIAQGFAEAKRTGRPLFVTFRCVPCKDCEGFDAEVAKGSDVIQQIAAESFVPVRQVEMKGVDLSQFQFDHDLNWAAMFLNADGTVYARYGTQSAEGADAYNSIQGLANTMRRVLDLHESYPANKAELEGKRADAKPYRTALEMPGMKNKQKLAGETARNNCIHCHMIHDAEQNFAYSNGSFTEDMLWRYPLPENIGLVINPQSGVRIMKVLPDSPAEKAGLKAGENVTHLNGQAITSIADMQWVLHGLTNDGDRVSIQTGKSGEHDVQLASGWKKNDISWRGSLWSLQPKLPVWMPPIEESQRGALKVPDDETPLLVKWINTGEPGGRAARDAGLKEGDVVVALAGEPLRFKDAQHFVMHVKLNYKVGDELPLTLLGKDGQRRDVRVKLVE
ncbi:MAG: PDZ domain-containing protein [Planctomycetota bacterium]|nr:PDZ domain-containing protein [Planctomycetota bacterium]